MTNKKIRFIIYDIKGSFVDLKNHLQRIKCKKTKVETTNNRLISAIISDKKCKELIRALEKNDDDYFYYEIPKNLEIPDNKQINLTKFGITA